MAKTYEVKFKEFDKNEGQEMQVRTNDIEFTVEQICRNRNIEDITYKEINVTFIEDTDEIL